MPQSDGCNVLEQWLGCFLQEGCRAHLSQLGKHLSVCYCPPCCSFTGMWQEAAKPPTMHLPYRAHIHNSSHTYACTHLPSRMSKYTRLRSNVSPEVLKYQLSINPPQTSSQLHLCCFSTSATLEEKQVGLHRFKHIHYLERSAPGSKSL